MWYVNLFIVWLPADHISHLIIDLFLSHLCLFSIQDDVLQLFWILLLLLQVVRNCIQGVNSLHIHYRLLKLEFFVHQHFLSKGVALSLYEGYRCLFLHFCCLLHILLRVFFLIGSNQFLGLILQDLDFVVEFLLPLFKIFDLDIQIIQGSFDFYFFLSYFFSFGLGHCRRWSCFLGVVTTEKFVKEWHLVAIQIIIKIYELMDMSKWLNNDSLCAIVWIYI